MTTSVTYNLSPAVRISDTADDCNIGWDRICAALTPLPHRTVIETYPGVDIDLVEASLLARLTPDLVLRSADAFLSPDEIEEGVYRPLGTDRVFAFMKERRLDEFFSMNKLASLRSRIRDFDGSVLIIGTGASLLAEEDACLIYADLSRWEIQARQRAHYSGNIGLSNNQSPASELYRRSFFVDWRAADHTKRSLLPRLHFLLDTHIAHEPKMIPGETFREALETTARGPFRVVPFFDPGPWGGHWMQKKFHLPDGLPNYAWGFDCVPEENSLRLAFADCIIEVPAIDLVFFQPEALLGTHVYKMFGAEFPIRFDYLDTMGGGNLSLQVHPLTTYIRKHFGMSYTQDESYYMLDAAPDATVFLGLTEDADQKEFEVDLHRAQEDADAPLQVEKYVNAWPAKKHDHYLIPAGTIHCSGKDSVVLEISATPYIFTFKLWDWARKGLDGKPRPIHLEHGVANLDWSRRPGWVRDNLINRFETVATGTGWREERTGLHPLEFIETRRHWFTTPVLHDTQGTVNVLCLVEGDEISVTSPAGAFEPFLIHYGETFIVPAQVGEYIIRPTKETNRSLATLKAYVREESTCASPDHEREAK
jgi:mannose-6-phosphate isomerase class I